jgi:hypothetical protein
VLLCSVEAACAASLTPDTDNPGGIPMLPVAAWAAEYSTLLDVAALARRYGPKAGATPGATSPARQRVACDKVTVRRQKVLRVGSFAIARITDATGRRARRIGISPTCRHPDGDHRMQPYILRVLYVSSVLALGSCITIATADARSLNRSGSFTSNSGRTWSRSVTGNYDPATGTYGRMGVITQPNGQTATSTLSRSLNGSGGATWSGNATGFGGQTRSGGVTFGPGQ